MFPIQTLLFSLVHIASIFSTIGCKANRCCGDAHVILVDDERDILLENRLDFITDEDAEDEV